MAFPKHAIDTAKLCMPLIEVIVEFYLGKNKCLDMSSFRKEK